MNWTRSPAAIPPRGPRWRGASIRGCSDARCGSVRPEGRPPRFETSGRRTRPSGPASSRVRGPVEVVLAQPDVQLRARESQAAGRLRLVPARVAHDALDRFALDDVEIVRRDGRRLHGPLQAEMTLRDQAA